MHSNGYSQSEMHPYACIGKRLHEERLRLGLNQADFGAIAGVKRNAQLNYEAGKRAPDAGYLSAIAEAGADVQYILTGQQHAESIRREIAAKLEGMSASSTHVSIRRHEEDLVHLPLYDARIAAGAGSHNGAEEIIDMIAFRKDWMSRRQISSADAVLARISGKSMARTISDGDMVMIDTSQKVLPVRQNLKDGLAPIYALLDDGEARAKRLWRPSEDLLMLTSDNPEFGQEDKSVADVTVIGRVVWWGHTERV